MFKGVRLLVQGVRLLLKGSCDCAFGTVALTLDGHQERRAMRSNRMTRMCVLLQKWRLLSAVCRESLDVASLKF